MSELAIYTIRRLIHGDAHEVSSDYERAGARWHAIMERAGSSVKTLAGELRSEQYWFENNCGDPAQRRQGQEAFVLVGLGQFFPPGEISQEQHEENCDRAELVACAFAASMCSSEVKTHARQIADYFGIGIEDE